MTPRNIAIRNRISGVEEEEEDECFGFFQESKRFSLGWQEAA